jgi:valyl-tRNA synthetase
MLNNERFVANAPEDVIAKNRADLADAEAKIKTIQDQLDSLQGN